MEVSENVANLFKWAPVALIIVVIIGLSLSDMGRTEALDPGDRQTRVERKPPEECQQVHESVRTFFQQNATDKQPEAKLSHGRIVKSPKSYQGRTIYFISFAVDGGKWVATWMQTGRDPSSSMQGAVRETRADELSVLGTAGNAPVHHLSWPGARESFECVRHAISEPDSSL